MKTYNVPRHTMGELQLVQVNVPSHKELQKGSERGDIRIVISNFSYGKSQEYSVAKFELEDNVVLIGLGFRFQKQAKPKDIKRFAGKHARQSAIECAADMLIGR